MSSKALFIKSSESSLFSSSSSEDSEKEDDYDLEVDWFGLRPTGSKRLRVGIYII